MKKREIGVRRGGPQFFEVIPSQEKKLRKSGNGARRRNQRGRKKKKDWVRAKKKPTEAIINQKGFVKKTLPKKIRRTPPFKFNRKRERNVKPIKKGKKKGEKHQKEVVPSTEKGKNHANNTPKGLNPA